MMSGGLLAILRPESERQTFSSFFVLLLLDSGQKLSMLFWIHYVSLLLLWSLPPHYLATYPPCFWSLFLLEQHGSSAWSPHFSSVQLLKLIACLHSLGVLILNSNKLSSSFLFFSPLVNSFINETKNPKNRTQGPWYHYHWLLFFPYTLAYLPWGLACHLRVLCWWLLSKTS